MVAERVRNTPYLYIVTDERARGQRSPARRGHLALVPKPLPRAKDVGMIFEADEESYYGNEGRGIPPFEHENPIE